MSEFTDLFNKKAELLLDKLCGGDFSRFDNFDKICGKSAAFISVSDTENQAKIFRASGDSAKEAWSNAVKYASKYISQKQLNPCWVKADITESGEKTQLSDVIATIGKNYNQLFRRGISFDDKLETALIEAEINGNDVISYKQKKIELAVVNRYLAAQGLKTLSEFPNEVILFDCRSAFCDENCNTYELYGNSENCGRRVIDGCNRDTAKSVILTAGEYLAMQIGVDGKFDYGYYPIKHRAIPGYNILRHASSIWSLLCAYRISNDKFFLEQAEVAIGYLVRNTFYKYRNKPAEENVVYVADKTKNEVKIGGNAVAIILLTEYMDIAKTDKYKMLSLQLGNGILKLFNKRDGSYFHVLKYPTLEPVEKNRTVYYDGESTFALARLYGLTKDKRFLDAAAKACDRFIREDYTKYADHWVAYALNEITKYLPEERYLNFALRNVQVNLKKIYNQRTTYHTYLEMLCASFELYSRIKKQNLPCSYLSEFDEKYFVKTIFRRAEFMLNGYCYPEYIMYFKYPMVASGAFFVRHDSYRIRIDDVQHFCGAYYSFYRNYDELKALLDL